MIRKMFRGYHRLTTIWLHMFSGDLEREEYNMYSRYLECQLEATETLMRAVNYVFPEYKELIDKAFCSSRSVKEAATELGMTYMQCTAIISKIFIWLEKNYNENGSKKEN